MPPVICLTTPSFQAAACVKSSCGSETPTPSFANVSRASCSACAVCTQAFVGMHPTRRQVPPSSGSCSMQTTLPPSWAARIAAVYPAGPPPRTATSHSIPAQPFSMAPGIVVMRARRGASVSRASRPPGGTRAARRGRSRPVVAVDAEADRLVAVAPGALERARRAAPCRRPCRARSARRRWRARASARRRTRIRAAA